MVTDAELRRIHNHLPNLFALADASWISYQLQQAKRASFLPEINSTTSNVSTYSDCEPVPARSPQKQNQNAPETNTETRDSQDSRIQKETTTGPDQRARPAHVREISSQDRGERANKQSITRSREGYRKVKTRVSPTRARSLGKRRRSAGETYAQLVSASSWLGVLTTSMDEPPPRPW